MIPLTKTKAQSAIEFMMLVGAVLIFILALMSVFQKQVSDKSIERRNFLLQELALQIQNEINIAAKSTDGYRREFTLPETAGGVEYDLTVLEGLIYLNTSDGKHAMAFPTHNATGQFIEGGTNVIEKRNGIIYVNSP